MHTISCFIVEDDPQAFSFASSIIKNYKNIAVIGNSSSINEAAELIKKLKPDFIILDVFLTDGNAFEFLPLFNAIEFKIIFTTSYAKYAIDAFKFSAIDYLLKPYEEKELTTAIDKVLIDINKTNHESQLSTLMHNISHKDQSKKIVLKNTDAIHVVDIKDILYAKSDNNYTSFLLTNNKSILVSKPLKSYDEKLRNHNFLRVHQSYLINLNYISSFNKRNEEVVLNEKHAIPVAQSRKKNLLAYIDELF
ncbi:LytTR family DNA-binding domain-containing protein [Cellulophaga sp. 20_2_10]|uniref:LytR/AlgR family response regulator transcription factor n=1 Tax=Cellulophaga sp. 20_2_10 TaxID=2942476 RepID=UPI00201B1151|nr:LytTR family DNA-binding domain-containing protein [Cellulophaga sp. 20_2_10]MCL5247141.1 LytTR family DNA-binding domain-containing protein [Cellulophaga sp. 20_2_10]